MSDDRSTTYGANATAMLPTPRIGLIRSVAHRLAGDPPELPVEGHLPTFDGATGWLNSEPLTPEGLRGRVVLVDFWTYTCINWLRTAPYLRAWDAKYRDLGLTVIGVHTPEFGFEGNVDNVIARTRGLRSRIPGRDRHGLRGLAGVREPFLARRLHRGRRGPHPLPPLRRGRVRHDGDGGPATAARGGRGRRRPGSRVRRPPGLRGRGRLEHAANPRDLRQLRSKRRLRVSSTRSIRRAVRLSRAFTTRPQPVGAGGQMDACATCRGA